MRRVSIDCNIKGKKLNDLFSFVGKQSTKMSIARYYDAKLSEDEYRQVQKEFEEFIYQEHKRRCLAYAENQEGYKDIIDNFLDDKRTAEVYFQDVLKQELDVWSSLKYEEVKDKNLDVDSIESTELIETIYLRHTPVTMGPLFEVCYFGIGDVFKHVISELESLFQFPYYIQGHEYEDIAFYNGDRIILAVCSHEQFATMNLTDQEYEKLLKLSILKD